MQRQVLERKRRIRARRHAGSEGPQFATGVDRADDAGTHRLAARPGRNRDPRGEMEWHGRRGVERPAVRLQAELDHIEPHRHGEAAIGEVHPAFFDAEVGEDDPPRRSRAGACCDAGRRGDRGERAGGDGEDRRRCDGRCRRCRDGRSGARRRAVRPGVEVPAPVVGALDAQARRAQRKPPDRRGSRRRVDARVEHLDLLGRELRRLGIAEHEAGERDPVGVDAQLRRAFAGPPVERQGCAQRAGERRREHAAQVGPGQGKRQGIELEFQRCAGGVALPGERELALLLGSAEHALALEDDGGIERPGDRLGIEGEIAEGERGFRCGRGVAPVELAGADRERAKRRLPARAGARRGGGRATRAGARRARRLARRACRRRRQGKTGDRNRHSRGLLGRKQQVDPAGGVA